MSSQKCPDCLAEIRIPVDVIDGEIVACPDCGLELQVKKDPTGRSELVEVTKEKEDWGE